MPPIRYQDFLPIFPSTNPRSSAPTVISISEGSVSDTARPDVCVLLLASFPVQVTTTVLTCLANVFNKSANGSAPVLEPEAVPSPTQITSGFFL